MIDRWLAVFAFLSYLGVMALPVLFAFIGLLSALCARDLRGVKAAVLRGVQMAVDLIVLLFSSVSFKARRSADLEL